MHNFMLINMIISIKDNFLEKYISQIKKKTEIVQNYGRN